MSTSTEVVGLIDEDERLEPVYAPVSPNKFAVLNVTTFGLYSVVWFYRCWRYVQNRDHSSILPWARALFNPLWYFAFLRDLRDKSGRDLSVGLAVVYLIFQGLWRLPDPYWAVSFLSFLPLLPAIAAVNGINRQEGVERPATARWRLRNVPVALVGLPLGVLVLASSSGFIPETAVVDGSELRDEVRTFMVDRGMIDPEEKVLLYYSAAMSFSKDGNLLTDQRVLSYEEVNGELWYASLEYEDIAAVEVVNSGDFWTDAVIAVFDENGEGFRLLVSTEGGGSKRFLNTLDRQWKAVRE